MAKTSKKRKEKRQSAARRRAEQHRTGYDRTTLKVGSDVNFFSLQNEGIVRLDVIPYKAGKGNPFADEGELHFERTYWAHRGIGANKDMYVCPARTARKPCPVCEYRAKLAKDPEANEDEVRDLAPKERQLWNVIDLADKDKGVQVWDISFHLFGKALDERIKRADEDDEFDFFYELNAHEGGRTLKLGIAENSFSGNKFYEVSTIDFKVRKTDYSEEILEEAYNLDDILLVPEYDKLKSLFMEAEQPEEDDEDEEEEKPKNKAKAKKEKASASEFSEGDEVEHEDFGVCRIIRVSGDGTSLTLEDEDGDKHRAVSVDDVEKVGNKRKSTKKKEPESEDEDDEDDDDWEDEEEEEEEPKKKTQVKEKESKSKKTKESDEDDDDDWD